MANRGKKVRLNKWIAQTSDLSRRAADDAISQGRVKINGKIVTALGTVVDPMHDHVILDNKTLRPQKQFIYLAFNKPPGCLVTKSDPKKRPTIWEFLKKFDLPLNSAGRLDFNSEGLLIITNDGNFLYQLTHPKHEVWKRYAVKVRGVPDERALSRLKGGVELDDRRTAPAKVRVTKGWENATWLDIEIREGRYRQVRRMCEKVGHQVTKLRRTAIGPVKLGRLGPGKWRRLTSFEIKKLKEASAK